MKNLIILFLILPFLGFAQLSGNFAPLSGEYNITTSNPLANFKTLASAVKHVNSVGISGPVTFFLDQDETVTTQIVINQIKGSSVTNTLTIRPNANKNVTISGNLGNSNTASLLKFNGSDYVILDGSNNGSSTRNLTMTNKSTENYDNSAQVHSAILWIASSGDGSNENKIQNINFVGANVDYVSSTSAAIVFSNDKDMNTAESISNSNNHIINNCYWILMIINTIKIFNIHTLVNKIQNFLNIFVYY